MCTRWSVTLNDISVVMVKPWVMTGSSSVVRPFQQSSSMQRQPDRRTCLYISTEEFPASWPAALHKETHSTWGCIEPQSSTACVRPCFESMPWKRWQKDGNCGAKLIPLPPLGNQLPPHISSKLYRNMLGIVSLWEADVCFHFRRHYLFHCSNLRAVSKDGNASPSRTKMNRLLSQSHKTKQKKNQGCVVCSNALSCSLEDHLKQNFTFFSFNLIAEEIWSTWKTQCSQFPPE